MLIRSPVIVPKNVRRYRQSSPRITPCQGHLAIIKLTDNINESNSNESTGTTSKGKLQLEGLPPYNKEEARLLTQMTRTTQMIHPMEVDLEDPEGLRTSMAFVTAGIQSVRSHPAGASQDSQTRQIQ